jgi:ABC-type multidrug transport system fused ATPase/permease subunit
MIVLLSTIASGAAVAIPISAKVMIDQINADFSFNSYARVVVLFFCAMLLRTIASVLMLWITTMMRFALMREFLEEIHLKLLMLKPQKASKYQSGTLTAHLLNDVESLVSGIESIINISVRYPLEYIGLIGVLFYISAPLTGIVLLAALLLAYCTMQKSQKLSSAQLERSKAKARLFGTVNENISYFKVIRVFDNIKHRMTLFRKQHEELTELEKYFIFAQAKFNLSTDILIAIFILCALLLIGSELASGRLTPGSMTAALVALITLSSSLSKYSRSIANLKASMKAGGYVEELSMQEVDDQVAATNRQPFIQQIHSLAFRDVHFFHNARPILQGVTFDLHPGRPHLLEGENGSGKSTIVDIIFGLYTPSSGEIFFNDTPQQNIVESDLLKRMALVPQIISIFNDSFRYNLFFGNTNATDDEIIAVAKLTGVSAALETHNRSLDEQAGDRGTALSPGEAQRISLARALLRKPDVLVMDEPTNNLDKDTVDAIWKVIFAYAKEHIVLVITHQVPPNIKETLVYRLHDGVIQPTV